MAPLFTGLKFNFGKNPDVSGPVFTISGGTVFSPGNGYIYNVFTSTGTLTVNGTGPAQIVSIGGGGAGGARNDSSIDGGGGGGGGGIKADLVLTSGLYNVYVGGGGQGSGTGGSNGGGSANPRRGGGGGWSGIQLSSTFLLAAAGGGGGAQGTGGPPFTQPGNFDPGPGGYGGDSPNSTFSTTQTSGVSNLNPASRFGGGGGGWDGSSGGGGNSPGNVIASGGDSASPTGTTVSFWPGANGPKGSSGFALGAPGLTAAFPEYVPLIPSNIGPGGAGAPGNSSAGGDGSSGIVVIRIPA